MDLLTSLNVPNSSIVTFPASTIAVDSAGYNKTVPVNITSIRGTKYASRSVIVRIVCPFYITFMAFIGQLFPPLKFLCNLFYVQLLGTQVSNLQLKKII